MNFPETRPSLALLEPMNWREIASSKAVQAFLNSPEVLKLEETALARITGNENLDHLGFVRAQASLLAIRKLRQLPSVLAKAEQQRLEAEKALDDDGFPQEEALTLPRID